MSNPGANGTALGGGPNGLTSNGENGSKTSIDHGKAKAFSSAESAGLKNDINPGGGGVASVNGVGVMNGQVLKPDGVGSSGPDGQVVNGVSGMGSTYGEVALIAAQNVAIASLVLHYGGKSASAAAFVAVLAGGVYALFNESLVDAKTMTVLQGAAGVLGVASKIPQIYTIWSEGGTGQLSAFAVFNFLFDSLSRIFTTLQEVKDPLILYGYVAGFTLNLIIAAQMVYYWNAPRKTTKKISTPAIRIQSEKGEPIPLSTGSDIPRSTTPSTRRRA